MVEIIKIDPSEIPIGGPKTRPEFDAVRALEVGEAIKFPCTWKHSITTDQCSGTVTLWQIARGFKRKIYTVCSDKWLYVHRIGKVK